ncbi:MAG: hypothetical protein AB7H97_15180 [Pseudobdellovibrionaceae bacterium]
MKRILTLSILVSAAVMMNGCTKCSREAPIAPPPAVEPVPGSAPVGDMPIEGAPTDETPSAPTDVTAPENK